jgi:hypothetical protein
MSSFCAKILSPKKLKPKLKAHKSCTKKLSYKTAARKILVKLSLGDRKWQLIYPNGLKNGLKTYRFEFELCLVELFHEPTVVDVLELML